MKARPSNAGRPSFRLMQLIAMTGLLVSGCGMVQNDTPSATCATGTAEIQVYDGRLERICGCSEGRGSITSGTSLNCTVSAGTRVFFNFVSIQQTHQIAVQGVTSTAPMYPSASSSVQTAVIYLNNTGSFTYRDFAYGIGGTFIVN